MVSGTEIQVEDGGFARVHNALLEALAKARLSGSEFRCLMFLFRKTYGWGKKEDRISFSQWEEGTDTKKTHVFKTLNDLVQKKVIYRRLDSGQVPFYGFNKYVEQWEGVGLDSQRGERFNTEKVLPKQVPLPKQVTVTYTGNSPVTYTGNGTVTKTGNNKRKKETVKEIPEHQKMFGALARVCRVDPKLKAGQIAKTAKTLIGASYTAEDIDHFTAWWEANDFRGRRGDPPTLAQVVDKIMQAAQERRPELPADGATIKIVLSNGQVTEARA